MRRILEHLGYAAARSCCARPARAGPRVLPFNAERYRLTRAGAGEDGNATGDLDIRAAVTIIGTGPDVPRLHGGTGFHDRILHVLGGNVTIQRVSLGFGSLPDGELGGGIKLESGAALTLDNVTVGTNTADVGGGGIYNLGQLSLSNSTISNNIVRNGSGGGILNDSQALFTVTNSAISNNRANSERDSRKSFTGGGGIMSFGPLLIERSTIENNQIDKCDETRDCGGGGLHALSDVTITQSTIRGNVLKSSIRPSDIPDFNLGGVCGGGVRIGDNNVEFLVERTLIEGNESRHGAGFCGGYRGSTNQRVLTRSVIRNNKARFTGGGVAGSKMTITETTISGNQAGANGGGMNLGVGESESGGEVHLYNTTISGNKADMSGGGVWFGHGVQLLIGNSSIVGNVANSNRLLGGRGGGIFLFPRTTPDIGIPPPGARIMNSVVANNREAGLGRKRDDCAAVLGSRGHNVFGRAVITTQETFGAGEVTDNCFIVERANPGTDRIGVDTKLGALGNNNGVTAGRNNEVTAQTHLPLTGSPLINKGDPDGCRIFVNGEISNPILASDERGRARVGRCDIGAAEAGS